MMRPASTSKKVVKPVASGSGTSTSNGLAIGGVGLQSRPSTTQPTLSSPQPVRGSKATTSSPKATLPLSTRSLNTSSSKSPPSTMSKCGRGGSISSSSSSIPRKREGSVRDNNANTVVVDTPKFTAAERGQLVCIGQDTMDAIERRLSEEAMLELRNEKIAARRAAIQEAEAAKQALAASRMRAGAERRARVHAANFL